MFFQIDGAIDMAHKKIDYPRKPWTRTFPKMPFPSQSDLFSCSAPGSSKIGPKSPDWPNEKFHKILKNTQCHDVNYYFSVRARELKFQDKVALDISYHSTKFQPSTSTQKFRNPIYKYRYKADNGAPQGRRCRLYLGSRRPNERGHVMKNYNLVFSATILNRD